VVEVKDRRRLPRPRAGAVEKSLHVAMQIFKTIYLRLKKVYETGTHGYFPLWRFAALALTPVTLLAGIILVVVYVTAPTPHVSDGLSVAETYCDATTTAQVDIRADGTLRIKERPLGSNVRFVSPTSANPLCEKEATNTVSASCIAFLMTDEGWQHVCIKEHS